MSQLKITLRRSLIGFEKSQRLTANALGLGKVGSSILQSDTPAIRGMIKKIVHVLSVETVEGDKVAPVRRSRSLSATETE